MICSLYLLLKILVSSTIFLEYNLWEIKMACIFHNLNIYQIFSNRSRWKNAHLALHSWQQALISPKIMSFPDITLHRSTISALQHAIITRPEITFSVNKLNQFLTAQTINHWQACKRILRYLKGTLYKELQFYSHGVLHIYCFSNADWISDRDDRRSIAGYCAYFGPNLVC